MISMTIDQVARAIGADGPHGTNLPSVTRVTTDSREVGPGDLFIAIPGQRVDGHDYVGQALARGAVGCVVRRASLHARADPLHHQAERLLTVDDTILALGDLAAFYREHIIADETTVIAVTGSNGKTTTKAMIHHVLSESMPGSAAPKSFNNHIGVPLTLLSGNEGDDFLVVEIGSNAPGEVAMLAAMTQPDVAVITSIGEAHLEGFGDLMGVAAEKASIFSALRPRGLAVVNADHPELTELLKGRSPDALCTFGLSSHAEFRVSSISCRLDRTVFELSHCGRVELGIAGAHHATNAAACFAACRRMGLSPVQIVDRLRCFQPVDGRCRVVELDGITLVDDTYNANPSSVSAAIATFSSAVEGRRVMVLGDMGELGPRSAEFHEVVTRRATESGLHVLIGVGPRMTAAINRVVGESVPHCQTVCLGDAAEASDAVPPLLLDGDTVWLKGSRATELDQVVKRIVAEVGRPTAVA